MLELPVALTDVLARGDVEGGHEACLRARIAGGEERHVDARLDQTIREKLHDCLDPAVSSGRHREPHRTEHSHVHQEGFTAMVPFLTSTDQTRPTARIPS